MLKNLEDLVNALEVVKEKSKSIPVESKIDPDYLKLYAEINAAYNATMKVRNDMAALIKLFLLTKKNHTFTKPGILAYIWDKPASKIVLPEKLKAKYTEKYTQEIVKVEIK